MIMKLIQLNTDFDNLFRRNTFQKYAAYNKRAFIGIPNVTDRPCI